LLQHQDKELVDESHNLASSLEVADPFAGGSTTLQELDAGEGKGDSLLFMRFASSL
jgi:hypothetical protein